MNFQYVNTPIITSNDAEGAGEMFRVTTLDPNSPPLEKNNVDFTRFFEKNSLDSFGSTRGRNSCLSRKVYLGPTLEQKTPTQLVTYLNFG